MMSRSRAALLGASAIVLSRVAKNSFCCNLMRSHGGLPSTTSNPPSSNTSGNSICQWKNCRRSEISDALATSDLRAALATISRLRSPVVGTLGSSGRLGMKNAAVHISQGSLLAYHFVPGLRISTNRWFFRWTSSAFSSGSSPIAADSSAKLWGLPPSSNCTAPLRSSARLRFRYSFAVCLSSPVKVLYASLGIPS